MNEIESVTVPINVKRIFNLPCQKWPIAEGGGERFCDLFAC